MTNDVKSVFDTHLDLTLLHDNDRLAGHRYARGLSQLHDGDVKDFRLYSDGRMHSILRSHK